MCAAQTLDDESKIERIEALNVAAYNGQTKIVHYLLSLDPKTDINGRDTWWCNKTALIHAVSQGQIEIIKVLLNASPKVDINAADDLGWTPLMFAVKYGNVEALKILLASYPKPDLNIKNEDGSTALKIARINSNSVIIKLLEKEKKPRKTPESPQQKKVFLSGAMHKPKSSLSAQLNKKNAEHKKSPKKPK